jgi:phospholipid/cholesterol/gamma-HCH transport system substrate-binding protein
MKSTSYQRAVVVGIFVFIGISIFVITVLTLGSQHKTFERSITVKSFFDDVNGLQKGNNVWFSGVKVGNIGKVKLLGNGLVEVDINVEVQSVRYIPCDARTRLSTDGLIGNKIIEIFGGTPGSKPIKNGDTLAIEKLVNTNEVMKTLSKSNDNLKVITNNIEIITDRLVEGKGTLGKLLNDKTVSDQLNKVLDNLEKASEKLTILSTNVAGYSEKLDEKGTFANDLISDTTVFSNLRETMTRLRQMADSSQLVIQNLQSATNSVKAGLADPKSPAGLLLHDEQSANQIKLTLQNLQTASKKLDEDLEAAQHNFLLRRYFKKKVKNATKDSTSN